MTRTGKFDAALVTAAKAYRNKQYNRAEAAADKILSHAPRHQGALQLKALLAHLRGDLKAAQTAIAAGLKVEPGHPQGMRIAEQIAKSLFAVACKARTEGRARDCIAACRNALQLAPGLAACWFELGLAEQDARDYFAAAEAFQKVTQLRPGDAKAFVNHGISVQQTGDFNSAWRSYRAAYRLDGTTFGLIAQVIPAASTGRLRLNLGELRRRLAAA